MEKGGPKRLPSTFTTGRESWDSFPFLHREEGAGALSSLPPLAVFRAATEREDLPTGHPPLERGNVGTFVGSRQR